MEKRHCKRTVLDYLEQAIILVYKQDLDVLTNKVSERCVCARLAYYLETIIRKDNSFDNYYVDVEYDRMEKASPKQIYGDKRHICDLLIHSRGNKKPDNLLALEMKVHNNYSKVADDFQRLTNIVQHSEGGESGFVRDTIVGVFLRMQIKQYKLRIFDVDINEGQPSKEIKKQLKRV